MTRTILITGASSGIGLATAKALAESGFRVIGTSRSAATDTEISNKGISMCQLDVCDDASVFALKQRLTQAGAMPDALILNAGFGISGPIEETSTASVMAQFDTNVVGVHRVIREFLPSLRNKRNSRIIVIGSMLGRFTVPFQSFYASSKAAIATYTEGLRMEVKEFGIKVSLIEPGDHQSDFASNRDRSQKSQSSPYEPQCGKALAIMEKSERNGPPARRVADMVHSVITHPKPKAQYLCIQNSERRLLWLKRILSPERFERFILHELGFTS